jgi:hypothetical protein
MPHTIVVPDGRKYAVAVAQEIQQSHKGCSSYCCGQQKTVEHLVKSLLDAAVSAHVSAGQTIQLTSCLLLLARGKPRAI